MLDCALFWRDWKERLWISKALACRYRLSLCGRLPRSGLRRGTATIWSGILTHYEDDVELRSPVASKLLGGDGRVRGKAGLREYFELGLKAYPHLRFELVEALWGIETIVLSYVNNVRGSKTAEVMLISEAGKIQGVWANYDQ